MLSINVLTSSTGSAAQMKPPDLEVQRGALVDNDDIKAL